MFNFNSTCPRAAHPGAEWNTKAGSTIMARLFVLMLLALLMPQAAHSQVLYGSLTGIVTDPKGAAVPGAKVEVTNMATSETRSVTSDERGGFTLTTSKPALIV